jgi:C-terminal processing protease CtpA/Prc
MLIGYDPQAQQYRMWRFSQAGARVDEGGGAFEGASLVITTRGQGTAVGLGFEGEAGTNPSVRVVAPGSPAARAGIQRGDVLLKVDGRVVAGLSTAEVRLLTRVEGGAPKQFTFQRNGKEFAVALTRAPIELVNRYRFTPKGEHGYMFTFESQTAGGFEKLQDTSFTPAP